MIPNPPDLYADYLIMNLVMMRLFVFYLLILKNLTLKKTLIKTVAWGIEIDKNFIKFLYLR